MSLSESILACAGCGWEPSPTDPRPFRCGAAVTGDEIDHVIVHRLDFAALSAAHGALQARAARDYWAGVFDNPEPNPFLKYREFLHAWHAAETGGLGEDDWRQIVTTLDERIAEVDGAGFRTTPFELSMELASAAGLAAPAGSLWLKNETGNVSGSHKGRHLMGIMIWLEVMQRLGRGDDRRLAIASCGNAALAAAVVAKAAGRPLDVYIPAGANASVIERLQDLGASLTVCPREPGVPGDPAYMVFRGAVKAGAIPFTCQGNENGLTIDGGKTLAFEMAASLRQAGTALDRVFVQVGGGALASAVIQGLDEAHCLGLIERMPRIHTVQTEGAHPLMRAWQCFTDRFGVFSQRPGPRGGLDNTELGHLNEAMGWASVHRSEFMWPWETAPHSIAHGILDDETYDWLAVLRGMLDTSGGPVIVDEALLIEATELVRRLAGIPADATGAAGVAGVLAHARRGHLPADERVAALVTGAER